jgi:cell division protein FtsI/penicillin-binding protein 2
MAVVSVNRRSRPARHSSRTRGATDRKGQARSVDALMPGRIAAVGVLAGMGFVGLLGRLYFLQIHRHDQFVEMARRTRVKNIRIPARRGSILDRNGALLVRTERAFTVVIDPNLWHHLEPQQDNDPAQLQQQTLATLRKLLPEVPIDEILRKRPLDRRAGSGRLRTVDLAEVTEEQADAIRLAIRPKDRREPGLIGVGLFPTWRRAAINGGLAPHVLGFTNLNGAGVEGIEGSLNHTLQGIDGQRTAEFVHSRWIPGTQTEVPAVDGKNVALTIDTGLQHLAEQALARACSLRQADSGTVVVLDASSRDVLAIANWPTYNVNQSSQSHEEQRTNRAVLLPIEPGSILKAVTIAAGLESGAFGPERRFYCSGARKIGKKVIHCAHHAKHGDQSLVDVLRHSCNLASAACADLMGPQTLFDFERKFGFGQRSGLPFASDSRGKLPDPSTWSEIQRANIAFGQGMSATPVQLATAYGVFVDGMYRPPRIVQSIQDPVTGKARVRPLAPARRVLSPSNAEKIRQMLQAAVDNGTGTRAQLAGYTAGGKTGTAQIAEHGKYRGKYLASFVGLAPLSKPQFIILVTIVNPKGEPYGSVVAAPVFREIAEQALLIYRTPRDKSETPPRPESPAIRSRLGEE